MQNAANFPAVKKIRQDYSRIKILMGVLLLLVVLVIGEIIAPSKQILSHQEINGGIYVTYKNFETGAVYKDVYIEDVPYFVKGRKELLEKQLAK